MNTSITKEAKSHIDFVMKSKGDEMKALETIVVYYIKHKILLILYAYNNNCSHNLGQTDAFCHALA